MIPTIENDAARSAEAARSAVLDRRPLRLVLNGAAPDTGNLGVSALSYAVISGIARRAPYARLTVFDHGFGVRESHLGDKGGFRFHRAGLRNSKRLYRPESLWNVRASLLAGGLGNPTARAIKSADAVLDITGGDSFTDLYGNRRFRACVLEKRLAMRHSGGLILLPQTFGPYRAPEARTAAASILSNAALAWARDQRSYDFMQELVGPRFDPERHRLGVDVAFALPVVDPGDLAPRTVHEMFESEREVLGFNVSGLILNNPDMARERFEFVADYREVVRQFLLRVLENSDADVLLVPHVATPTLDHFESDEAACAAVEKMLPQNLASRVHRLSAPRDPRHAKWIIGRTSWFCGTRMHSTIAGLSSGVPTAAIAYSVKTRGVFATCGQEEHVADPRESGTEEVIEKLWQSWQSRDQAQESLSRKLPAVLQLAESQMDSILSHCGRLAAARSV